MTSTADKVVSIAKSQIGYREGYSAGHWNNIEKYAGQVPGLEWANGQPWCAVFVCWVAQNAGAAALYPLTASVATAESWWKGHGRWSEYPAIGAQVIYGNGEHTGIVVGYDSLNVTTVEGNTNDSGSAEGNGVYLKTHARSDPWITGYGYPKFPEGISSADPAYAKEAPVVLTSRGANVDAAIVSIRKAIKANAGHPIRLTKLRAALAALLSIRPRK
jgi:hypothetical protein